MEQCDRIRIARLAKGLTKAEMADRLGVSELQFTRWEAGDGLASVEILEAIATSTGVHLEWLFRGIGISGLKA